MQLKDLEAQVQELKDRQEIEQLLYYYLDLADRSDHLAQARECFHEDGLFIYQKGSEPVLAKDFFEQAVSEGSAGSGFVQTMHYLTNVVIRVFGDSAISQSYIFAQHLISRDCPDLPPNFPNMGRDYGLLIGARYNDLVTKRNGKWRLAKRELNYEWDARIDPSQISGPLASHRKLVPSEFWDYRP